MSEPELVADGQRGSGRLDGVHTTRRPSRDEGSSDERFFRFVSEADAAVRGRLQAALNSSRDSVAVLTAELESLRAHNAHVENMIHEIASSRAYAVGLAARSLRTGLGALLPRRRARSSRQEPAAATFDQVDTRPSASRVHPLVSVVMPVFNKGTTLVESVRSVQQQTFVSWELVVWDDGSTDPETLRLLDELEGPGIRVVRSRNNGVIRARNAAVEQSRGRFLCFLDPDDLLRPTYLEKAVLYLESHPDVGLVYPWTRYFEGEEGSWPVPDLHPRIIAQQNQVPVCALVRREVFDATGGFSDLMESGCEDWELWAHACELGFVGRAIPEHLFDYRFSSTSGRDAAARPLFDEHRLAIMNLHPDLGSNLASPASVPWTCDPRATIDGQPSFLPHGVGCPVLFFVPWLTAEGGAEAFLRELATSLVGEGRTVVFVCTNSRPRGTVDGVELMHDITPYVYDLPHFLPESLWQDFCRSLGWRLHVPVIVNVGSAWLYDNIDLIRGSLRGPANVVDILFNHIGHMPTNIAKASSIDQTVVVHSTLERLLVEHFRVPSEVVTVPVGIPVTGPHPPSDVRSGRVVFGWLGRYSPEKRPEWFLRLAQSTPNARFQMAGTGPLLEDLRGAAAGVPNLATNGFVEDNLAFLDQCDVLINTSEIEGISLVAMEAIARGVPVVTSDVGGMADLVIPDLNGFLYDADSFVELQSLVARLAGDRQAVERLRQQTRESGLAEEFHVDSMLKAFSAVFG